jgi:hypothetical protein
MRQSTVTLAIIVPVAMLAIAGAAWLLHAEVTAFEAADAADAPPPAVIDDYRPGPGWMHRDAAGLAAAPAAPASPLHTLTNAGVSPTLVRWIPLP